MGEKRQKARRNKSTVALKAQELNTPCCLTLDQPQLCHVGFFFLFILLFQNWSCTSIDAHAYLPEGTSLVSFFSHFILEGIFLSKASLDVAFPCISVETFVAACALQPLSPTHHALLSSPYFQWMGLKTMYSCMKFSKIEITKKKIVIRLPWWVFFFSTNWKAMAPLSFRSSPNTTSLEKHVFINWYKLSSVFSLSAPFPSCTSSFVNSTAHYFP